MFSVLQNYYGTLRVHWSCFQMSILGEKYNLSRFQRHPAESIAPPRHQLFFINFFKIIFLYLRVPAAFKANTFYISSPQDRTLRFLLTKKIKKNNGQKDLFTRIY